MLKKWFNIIKKKQNEDDNEEYVSVEKNIGKDIEEHNNELIELKEKESGELISHEELVEIKEESIGIIENIIIDEEKEIVKDLKLKENSLEYEEDNKIENSKIEEINNIDFINNKVNNLEKVINKSKQSVQNIKSITNESEDDIKDKVNNEKKVEDDLDFIKEIKVKRAKSIRAINIYTNEKIEFKTYAECSRKLKIPLSYIKENILFGYTEYFGDAINYIGEQLGLSEFENKNDKYLEIGKNPFETYKQLNDRIFSAKTSEEKRSKILTSSKLEPTKMAYSFECLDYDYDDYYSKYKDIIKRTGKKKVELIKKNGEVLEVFKSIEECANYLNIDKSKVLDMLRCGETKVDRNYIRYSFRKI